MHKEEIKKKINELSPWGQRIEIIEGICTPGPLDTRYRWEYLKNLIPKDFCEGDACLGCRM